ncbi:MAG: hypothetical protein JNK05_11515 [Myxococcales bacterium]|nr:hypothetical protein [Myxococcales bacterium]
MSNSRASLAILASALAACSLPHARLRDSANGADAVDDLATDVAENDAVLADTISDEDALDDRSPIDVADAREDSADATSTDVGDASDAMVSMDVRDASEADSSDATATDAPDVTPADSAPCAAGTFDCGDGRCRPVLGTIATCADARDDGVHVLTIGGAPWCGFCQAFGGGDRFVMVLKADGTTAGGPTPQRFAYDSTLWTNMETFEPHNVDRDRRECKTRGMLVYPVRDVLVEVSTGESTNRVRGSLVSGSTPSIASLRAVFLGGDNAYGSAISVDNWLDAVPDSRLQPWCRRSGFNVRANSRGHARVRIGAIGNENAIDSCDTHDSWVGVGGVREDSDPSLSFSAGNVARANWPSDRTIRSFATVWVR